MKIITSERIPIKMWIDDIEDGALQQAKNLANAPFSCKHIAIMPDSHQGYGMPIGGVLATKDVIVPNAVGVDIGCGMLAVKTNITEIPKDVLAKIKEVIERTIPTGFKHLQSPISPSAMPLVAEWTTVVLEQYEAARSQLGTLGGGNHFIEIQEGSDGFIWFMIHSGSRNLGFRVAQYHNKIAMELNEKWFSSVPKKYELAFLPLDSNEAKEYISEMDYCVDFAYKNRHAMSYHIKDIISNCMGKYANQSVGFTDEINIAHNYATKENHFGENYMIHRKGATLAREDVLGIVPGSQGTSSYIVKGKGNRDSFTSCSHGAGRRMGRGQATRDLSLDKEIEFLNNQGILHSIVNVKDLDEAPSAYKDIDIVMENQKDLVEILVKLKPLAVIKGD